MVTQCITAAVLFGAGGVIAQQAVEGKGGKPDVSKFFFLSSSALVSRQTSINSAENFSRFFERRFDTIYKTSYVSGNLLLTKSGPGPT